MTYPPPKSEWREGPWTNEPDEVEFEHAGFPCVVSRVPETGALCGYVGLPHGHPWFGMSFMAIDASVHGCLTYGAEEVDEDGARYWIGFDTAHGLDRMPAIEALFDHGAIRGLGGTYRDLAYVRRETERLAEQARTASA